MIDIFSNPIDGSGKRLQLNQNTICNGNKFKISFCGLKVKSQLLACTE